MAGTSQSIFVSTGWLPVAARFMMLAIVLLAALLAASTVPAVAAGRVGAERLFSTGSLILYLSFPAVTKKEPAQIIV
jgi:uncharacterized protein (DUF58 family)